MKKIIFFMPNIERGGIEKNLIILCNYFQKKNFEIEIFYSKISEEIKKKLNKNIILNQAKNYINFKFLPNRINNSINTFISLFISKIKYKTIILSMQDHPFAILVARKKKLNCVLRIANHPDHSLKFFNNLFKLKIKLFIKLFFYRYAKGIICNSKSSAFYLKNKKINKNIVCIFNPIKLKKNINSSKKNYLLTVGRLENQKNIKGIILAFKQIHRNFKNYKLIIVGSGQEKKMLEELVHKNQLNDKVKFYKFNNPEKYYKSSKIFILNSFFEGLPNVLIEALNYKLPIISADCESGPREILSNGKYGFLTNVNDNYLLAKKIKYVLKNYSIAKKKSKLGFESLNRFELHVQCKKYENFLLKFF